MDEFSEDENIIINYNKKWNKREIYMKYSLVCNPIIIIIIIEN
jgi:hypothetical protein